jgi:hypothetical protein
VFFPPLNRRKPPWFFVVSGDDGHGGAGLLLAVGVYRNGERKHIIFIPTRRADGWHQDTGNKVSRRATIAGPQNIILGGKTIIAGGAIIRGDLRRTGPGHTVVISLGRYSLVGEGCIVRYVLGQPLPREDVV